MLIVYVGILTGLLFVYGTVTRIFPPIGNLVAIAGFVSALSDSIKLTWMPIVCQDLAISKCQYLLQVHMVIQLVSWIAIFVITAQIVLKK